MGVDITARACSWRPCSTAEVRSEPLSQLCVILGLSWWCCVRCAYHMAAAGIAAAGLRPRPRVDAYSCCGLVERDLHGAQLCSAWRVHPHPQVPCVQPLEPSHPPPAPAHSRGRVVRARRGRRDCTLSCNPCSHTLERNLKRMVDFTRHSVGSQPVTHTQHSRTRLPGVSLLTAHTRPRRGPGSPVTAHRSGLGRHT